MDSLEQSLKNLTPAPSDDHARGLCLEIVRRAGKGPDFTPPELLALIPFYESLSHKMRMRLHVAVFRVQYNSDLSEQQLQQIQKRQHAYHYAVVSPFLEIFGTYRGAKEVEPVVPAWVSDGSLGEL